MASPGPQDLTEALLRAPPVRAVPPTPDKDFEDAHHQPPGSPVPDIHTIQQAIDRGRRHTTLGRTRSRLAGLDEAENRVKMPTTAGQVEPSVRTSIDLRTRVVTTVGATSGLGLQAACWSLQYGQAALDDRAAAANGAAYVLLR